MSARERSVYVDSSILVACLTRTDPREQRAHRWLRRQQRIVSSTLAEVEVGRALGRRDASQASRAAAQLILASCSLVEVTSEIRALAAQLAPKSLRTLDALHVATATAAEVSEFATFDVRQQVAAEEASLKIAEVD